MQHLSIDIETYSSVDLTKSGLFKYVQSPDFEILMLAWSLDGSPVQVIDLACGEGIPSELGRLLYDPGTIKHAYNAAFEWYCLSKFLGLASPEKVWLSQWQCTMLHGLYCGYPSGLDAVGKALGLPRDKQKSATGKGLIRYFCVPCKPTKANGGRTRNLPYHNRENWRLFKEYCAQDVVTEMAVDEKLRFFPVPPQLQKQWETDQAINARGVAADTELMEHAIWCGDEVKQSLMDEAVSISGLQNPNSLQQLTKWLETEMDENIPDMKRDTVKDLLARDIESDAARRMLEIRQLLGKTSTKKYNAMENAVCGDGRIRGLMQFYKANRTGRWAGAIVQPQNLPRTYIEPLPLARELVKSHELDAIQLCYGSVPDTLSQLIRTAFTAAPGRTLIDADFSAIEARVIAWLAGEQWRLEVFNTHGRIYEASASAMFGVPIDLIKKGNPEYALRQKGKVAELALGYQGGPGALISMGALDMGLAEDELPDIVSRWRSSNKQIVALWYEMNRAALEVVETGAPSRVKGLVLSKEYDPVYGLSFFTIALPSGRKLYYANPRLTVNRWGNPAIGYDGQNQTTKKWQADETYGGKLVENCVQAIARDCLAESIERLDGAGFDVVFHVHDEIVIDYSGDADTALDTVCDIMGQPMPWAPDLPLKAEGWAGEFYRKD